MLVSAKLLQDHLIAITLNLHVLARISNLQKARSGVKNITTSLHYNTHNTMATNGPEDEVMMDDVAGAEEKGAEKEEVVTEQQRIRVVCSHNYEKCTNA